MRLNQAHHCGAAIRNAWCGVIDLHYNDYKCLTEITVRHLLDMRSKGGRPKPVHHSEQDEHHEPSHQPNRSRRRQGSKGHDAAR